MKSAEYYWGFFVGFCVVLAVFIVIVVLKRKREPKPEFDEMQIAARGRAFRTGFFSLLIASVPAMIICDAGISWLPSMFVFFAADMLGVAIFCVSAIRNEAYFGFNENRKSGIVFIAAAGLINLCLGIANIVTGGIIKGGELNMGVLNILVAVLSAVILAAILIHRRASAASTEEGDD